MCRTRSGPRLLIAVVLALALLLSCASASSSSKKTTTDTSSSSSSSTSATPSTVTTVPIPSAQADSSTFDLVDDVVCNTTTSLLVQSLYSKNRGTFDRCVTESDFEIFPYTGTVPTADDTTRMFNCTACVATFTAVVMLDLPACSLGLMPVSAVVETLLKLYVDYEAGIEAPSAVEFHALMAWRRDSDAARDAGEPYDSSSALYKQFAVNLDKGLSETSVSIASDLTISYDGKTASEYALDSSSVSDTVASVQAADTSSSKSTSTSTASSSTTSTEAASAESANTQTSDAMGASVCMAQRLTVMAMATAWLAWRGQ